MSACLLPDRLFTLAAGGHQKVIGDAGRVLNSGSGDRIPGSTSVGRARPAPIGTSRRGKEPP